MKKIIFSLIGLAVCYSCTSESTSLHVVTQETLQALLADEDTDQDKKITKDDTGDKVFMVEGVDGNSIQITSTYHLSNLLQELALARENGQDTMEVSMANIAVAPSEKINKSIRYRYWDDLTRTVDKAGLERILTDTKSSDTVTRRLYVPATDTVAQNYFLALQDSFTNFKVEILPKDITPEYVRSINDKPGILALKLENGKGVPFVVPGGRFNEMYGWDSYFEGVGLLIDGRIDLAKAMVDNFCYQIEHYGKILNANRSYYLTRTQPPFLSSFIKEVFEASEEKDTVWLRKSLETAIREYETVWMVPGKRYTSNQLNRYFSAGLGIPPETEPGHFDEVLEQFMEKYNLTVPDAERFGSLKDFVDAYQSGKMQYPELDTYFVHDRSMRESGHDTTWRLDNRTTDLNTVGLNALLYKYETDFAILIRDWFDGVLTTSSGTSYTSEYWETQAAQRKELMDTLMWDEERGSYYDIFHETNEKFYFDAATNFYPLWAGIADTAKAGRIVETMMKKLKAHCGFLASTLESSEAFATNDVQRQWDYPNGWAPHQMLLWRGLQRYGFQEEASEMAYRWLWMITRNAVDYNGTIPEKYDVVNCTHKVYAEYGNVGTDFAYITPSGFGWMNASYQLGLVILSPQLRSELDDLTDPEEITVFNP